MRKNNSFSFIEESRKKRPAVHSKCKSSNLKGSKNYIKKYRGQGRW